MSEGTAEKLIELADDERICMLTTVDPDGRLVARPMAHQGVSEAGELWFFVERDSRKVGHVARDPHVSVTMASADSWVSLDGSAEVVDDDAKAEELWNTWVEAWLPQGPRDGSVVLLKVTAETGEYWDSPAGRAASVVSLVTSKVTGERYDGGENERVDL